jgi:EAL domain-containing protein (putative c-di-GMP-specific phosphodiesterase class I)
VRVGLTSDVPNVDDLAEDLDAAVRRREIFVVFQPQISLETGATVGVEALCRWTHPALGVIVPDVFIPLAEQAGIIGALGSFVLHQSLAAGSGWRTSGRRVEMAINVSPMQLADDDFCHEVTAEVEARSLPPSSLTIEITESLPLIDRTAVAARLQELRAIGIGVSLDDFGSGHASQQNLETLPLTEVKLDGSLIREPWLYPDEQLSGILQLAHDRRLRVVAEGVETLSDLDRAVALGCDRAQGFLVGPPVPRADLESILDA